MSLFRFLGLNPPPPKAARKSYPNYEKKRERKFLEKWNKIDNGEPRDWLTYDSEEGVMCCKHCVAHAVDRKESFIVGCAVLKLDNIKKHEQTQSHIRSSEIAFAILAPDKTAGQQLRRQLTAAHTLKMSTMFQTSHALVLAKHFKPVVQSRLEVGKLNEWTSLKADVYSGRDWEKTLSTLDWSEINRLYSSYSNLLSLMDLVLTLPVSTAECERGFSWLKRTKTDWRSSLHTKSLNKLMCVALESPIIAEFDPIHPIELCSNKTINRRSMRYAEGTRRRSAQPSTSAEEAEISAESPEAAERMEQGDPSAYDEEKELQLWLSLDGDADEEEEDESAHQTEKLNLNERQHTPESPFSIADNSGDEEDLGEYELTASAILKGLSGVRSFRFNFLDGDEAERWC